MTTLLLLLTFIAAAPDRTDAQGLAYPLSQRASVSQNVAFTTITVSYGRPFARGRVLFSELIPWDKVWHPGADSATIVAFSKDVLLEGKNLPAGEYSLWLIPRETAAWTVIFSKAAHVFHQPYPGEAQDALRLDVQPERGSHMEAMMIYFPEVNREDAVMRIHWGDRIVPVKIKAAAR